MFGKNKKTKDIIKKQVDGKKEEIQKEETPQEVATENKEQVKVVSENEFISMKVDRMADYLLGVGGQLEEIKLYLAELDKTIKAAIEQE